MARAHTSLYELLEVSASASREEIEASYHRILGFLGPDSLAMYAMLDDDEADRLRAQIDEAYRTLTDPERRAAYDRSRDDASYPSVIVSQTSTSDLTIGHISSASSVRETTRDSGHAPRGLGAGQDAAEDSGRRDSTRGVEDSGRRDVARVAPGRDPAPPRGEAMAQTAALVALEAEADGESATPIVSAASRSSVPVAKGKRRLQPRAALEVGPDTEFSGSLLRRLRESADATLDDLAEITKISKRYLNALEENDFDTLPAFVYVRGFVCEYARALGLDTRLVSNSYMSLYRRYRGESG